MKALLYFLLGLLFPIILHASNLPQIQSRYEASGYFNMVSYGKNVSSQSDLGLGLRVFDFLNLEATVNVSYRNYSLASNDYLAVTFGKAIKNNEFRLGPIAGFYTLWLSRYYVAFPGIGAEAIYSYTLHPGISVRLKERVFEFTETRKHLFSTSTLIGFCYAFGGRPFFGSPKGR
jgi:hypothetical protein